MARNTSPYLGGVVASEQGASELDLRRVARVLRRWTLLILVIALDLAALMFFLESSKTPYFQSNATIELTDLATSFTGELDENVSADNEISNQVVVLSSQTLLERALTQLGYEDTGDFGLDARVRDNTKAIEVSAQAASAEEARDVLASSLEIYRLERRNTFAAPLVEELNGLNEDRADLQAGLDEAQVELDRLQADNDASPAAIATADERRANLVVSLDDIDTRIRELERDITTRDGDMTVLSAPSFDQIELGRSPVRGAALGFIGGLIVGTLGVLVVVAIRDKVALTTDIEGIAGDLPILATIPRFDRKVEAAGGPIINAPGAKREAEAFRFLAASMDLLTVNDRPATVTITSSGKSDGKTTTSVNLSLAMGRDGHRVALVDGDVYRIGSSRALGVKATVSTIDVLLGKNQPSESIVGYRSGDIAINLMPGRPMGSSGPSPMTHDRLRPMLDTLRASHDLVFVDSPPVLAVSDAIVAASSSDLTVVVVRLGHTRRRDLRRTLAALEQAGVRIGGIVVTYTKDRSDTYYDY